MRNRSGYNDMVLLYAVLAIAAVLTDMLLAGGL
jgi:hypothetical protein